MRAAIGRKLKAFRGTASKRLRVPDAASTFGGLLREFRARAGLSQSDLAEKANISEAAVGALERGTRKAPYRNTVLLLARALELTAQESAALEGARSTARAKPAGGVSHNLEAERTSFVGREDDLKHILALLLRSRLVTVTGSGGVGKTRAALEAARHVLGDPFPEVWFIDLAPLTDGDFVVSKIANTLQPPLPNRAETVTALVSALAERHILLILDNCEHVIAHAAQVADRLLAACPNVTILATSRERLNVAGEFVYRLPSLSLPPDTPDSIEDARSYSAIELFIERATAADPLGTFDSRNIGAVVDTVRHLDGIPLAIELSAAQVQFLGIETLRDRLYKDFSVPSGRRDLPARQQTVNATIRWSFELLSNDEKTLLADIAVFSGGFTLDAAEHVASDAGNGPAVLSHLSALVDKSLVSVERSGGSVRYALLESVRAFALEQLNEAGGYTDVARRHAQWFAARADDNRFIELSHGVASALLPDIDNMRNAIAWSLNGSSDDRQYAGHIVSGFDRLWEYIGRPQEHRHLLEDALERIDEAHHPRIVSRLLCDFMIHAGREPAALTHVDRAIRMCEQFGDRSDQTMLHIILTFTLQAHGRLAEAEHSAQRAADLLLSENMQDSTLNLAFLANRHELRMTQGRFDDARADIVAAESQALAHEEHFWVVCHCYSRYSTLEYAVGNKDLALEFAERMVASEFRASPYVAEGGLGRIVMLRLDRGDLDGAVKPLRELIQLRPIQEFAARTPLEHTALYLALRGRANEAARLLGCVRAVEQRTHFRRARMQRDAYDRLCALLQEQLSPQAIAEAEAAGAQLTYDQATAEALAALA